MKGGNTSIPLKNNESNSGSKSKNPSLFRKLGIDIINSNKKNTSPFKSDNYLVSTNLSPNIPNIKNTNINVVAKALSNLNGNKIKSTIFNNLSSNSSNHRNFFSGGK